MENGVRKGKITDSDCAAVLDRGMTLGCSHPMGPMALADLIGLDIVAAVSQALYEEFKEPVHAVPPVLSRMVDSGLLGRKTGRGFYSYELRFLGFGTVGE